MATPRNISGHGQEGRTSVGGSVPSRPAGHPSSCACRSAPGMRAHLRVRARGGRPCCSRPGGTGPGVPPGLQGHRFLFRPHQALSSGVNYQEASGPRQMGVSQRFSLRGRRERLTGTGLRGGDTHGPAARGWRLPRGACLGACGGGGPPCPFILGGGGAGAPVGAHPFHLMFLEPLCSSLPSPPS